MPPPLPPNRSEYEKGTISKRTINPVPITNLSPTSLCPHQPCILHPSLSESLVLCPPSAIPRPLLQSECLVLPLVLQPPLPLHENVLEVWNLKSWFYMCVWKTLRHNKENYVFYTTHPSTYIKIYMHNMYIVMHVFTVLDLPISVKQILWMSNLAADQDN